jgi:RNA polymerase sigma-70 factor, ECF subfamily
VSEALPESGDLGAYRNFLRLLALDVLRRLNLAGIVDPSDAVQDTLLRAHERADQFRGTTEGERRAWRKSILANILVDVTRKRGSAAVASLSLDRALEESSAQLEAIFFAESESPSDAIKKVEDRGQLHAAIEALPAEYREAVTLRYLEGRGVEEVAAAMGKTRAAVAGYLRRALQQLRGSLNGDGEPRSD